MHSLQSLGTLSAGCCKPRDCAEQVLFTTAWWVGTKEENPEEKQLPFPDSVLAAEPEPGAADPLDPLPMPGVLGEPDAWMPSIWLQGSLSLCYVHMLPEPDLRLCAVC